MAGLLACGLAVILILGGGHDSGGDSLAGSRGDRSGARSSQRPKRNTESVPKTYVVQPGDNLGVISDRYRVAVAKLERLNPDIDPQTLNAGQELKLR